jgi:hypothetical protein
VSAPEKPELFTVLITGKGIRLRVRVPGWVAAVVFRFAKENS